ncbi:MAG: T9SS type A sorting domain-containing protein [Bacteroidia bacterium]|nr:T9SS type A sorting domain-containing protein [Bacteroidia bacterium]
MLRILPCFLFLLVIGVFKSGSSQNCSNLNLQWISDIGGNCSQMVMTMHRHSNPGSPYLFVANKEAGLKVYDISVPVSPSLLSSVSTFNFDTLDVMNLCQDGQYLYLALGNHFTSPQAGGMAIVDVANPAVPVVTDFYVVPNSGSGAGIVKVEGNIAYLGAMESGLVLLDISNKYNIQLISQIIPPISFPPVSNPNPATFNARGMEVKNGIVYLCYDAGGIRIINCTNPATPLESGRWCNPAMYLPFNMPKAYNNCILDDTLLYVAVDYAGMEVLNVKDTSAISLVGWWNPYNAPANNWFTSPGHMNEMAWEKNCRRIFLSSGKSDLHVIDVSNPAAPDSCNYYGGVSNSIGTWGVSLYQNQLFLSYICAAVPFSSLWTGVKLLSFNSCSSGFSEEENSSFRVFPNPAGSQFRVEWSSSRVVTGITVYNSNGAKVLCRKIREGESETFCQDVKWDPGIYFISCQLNSGEVICRKLIID